MKLVCGFEKAPSERKATMTWKLGETYIVRLHFGRERVGCVRGKDTLPVGRCWELAGTARQRDAEGPGSASIVTSRTVGDRELEAPGVESRAGRSHRRRRAEGIVFPRVRTEAM